MAGCSPSAEAPGQRTLRPRRGARWFWFRDSRTSNNAITMCSLFFGASSGTTGAVPSAVWDLKPAPPSARDDPRRRHGQQYPDHQPCEVAAAEIFQESKALHMRQRQLVAHCDPHFSSVERFRCSAHRPERSELKWTLQARGSLLNSGHRTPAHPQERKKIPKGAPRKPGLDCKLQKPSLAGWLLCALPQAYAPPVKATQG